MRIVCVCVRERGKGNSNLSLHFFFSEKILFLMRIFQWNDEISDFSSFSVMSLIWQSFVRKKWLSLQKWSIWIYPHCIHMNNWFGVAKAFFPLIVWWCYQMFMFICVDVNGYNLFEWKNDKTHYHAANRKFFFLSRHFRAYAEREIESACVCQWLIQQAIQISTRQNIQFKRKNPLYSVEHSMHRTNW